MAKHKPMGRCGYTAVQHAGLQGFALISRWPSNDLRYRIENTPSGLNASEVRLAIQAAFALWSQAAQLTFTETASADAELHFRFIAPHNGDDLADGQGNILANAFFPPPAGGDLAGQIHFDLSETWSLVLPPSGTDLITVAAHEIGHALGLDHSNQPGSLMLPSFSGPHRFLDTDDQTAIGALYGRRF